MSQQYDNTNRGILARNDRREKDTHPEFAGNINIDGVEYWLSGWVKERKDGTGKFFSLSVRPKEQAQSNPAQRPAQKPAQKAGAFDDMDSDVPF